MPTSITHHKEFKPFVVTGNEWVRYVAVCRMVAGDPEDPFDPTDYFIDVACEYAVETPPDAFGAVHRAWHSDGPLSMPVETYYAHLASRMLADGTAYVEVPA